jgi:hypothetical protein
MKELSQSISNRLGGMLKLQKKLIVDDGLCNIEDGILSDEFSNNENFSSRLSKKNVSKEDENWHNIIELRES